MIKGIAVGAIYALIAARVFVVSSEIEARIERQSVSIPIVAAAVWPLAVLVIGTMAVLVGHVPILDPAYKYQKESR